MLIKAVMLISAVALFSGCATGINLARYKELDCDRRDCEIQPPDYIVNKKKPKVAILPLADVTEFGGKLAKPAQETLTQMISSGTGLEVVERSQVDKLFEESSFKGSLTGDIDPAVFSSLVKDIDFVLLGSISSVSAGAKFTEASTWKDKKGEQHRVPPSCSITAEAVVNVRAVSTRSGTIHKVFRPFKGSVSGSTQVRSSSECRINDPAQLAVNATTRAIENARYDFMDEFPNLGYVSKTMTNPDNGRDRVAVITLGRNDGLKAGDRVVLARYVKSYDRIKKVETLSVQDLGEVQISETGLSDEQSYVVIPEEFSGEVAVGYIVKTKADRGLLNRIFRK